MYFITYPPSYGKFANQILAKINMQNKLRRSVCTSFETASKGCEKAKDKVNCHFPHSVWAPCVFGIVHSIITADVFSW